MIVVQLNSISVKYSPEKLKFRTVRRERIIMILTCAVSLFCPSCVAQGSADKKNEQKFFPISLESLGPINGLGMELITDVGRYMSAISG